MIGMMGNPIMFHIDSAKEVPDSKDMVYDTFWWNITTEFRMFWC